MLNQFWRKRVGYGPTALDRTRTLRSIVERMLRSGRQSANPADLPAEASMDAYVALHHNGVLREAPSHAASVQAPVGFAHPVLFDYAVAMLALGDLDQPASLAEALDRDPDLAMTVRPSLEYRLASAWASGLDRQGFWQLAFRLAGPAGHPLAANEAARVAALLMDNAADLRPLADAATAPMPDQNPSWGTAEARYLAFLVAAAVGRNPSTRALACLDSLICELAQKAAAADDVNLAALAAQLPMRTSAQDKTGYQWSPEAAIACMTTALKEPGDRSRATLADLTGPFLARVAQHNPEPLRAVITDVIAPPALRAWGMTVIRHLIRVLAPIARKAPDIASEIAAAPWEFEEDRLTPTHFIASAITPMSSTLAQDLEGERHAVGSGLPELMRADPLAATRIMLRVVNRPAMHPLPPVPEMREQPRVRAGRTLALAGGNKVLPGMIDSFARELHQLADAAITAPPGATQPETTVSQIIAWLTDELQHDEVWKRILHQAATGQSVALARALLPALSTSSLYAWSDTWVEAAHAACRAAASLAPGQVSQIRAAIDGIPDAGILPTRPEYRDVYEQRRRQIADALDHPDAPDQDLPAPAGGHLPGMPPAVRDISDLPIYMQWETDLLEPGSLDDIARKVDEQLQRPAHLNEGGDPTACAILTALWDELDQLPASAARRQEARDLAVQIARRLAGCPDITPDSHLAARIVATLLDAVPDAEDAARRETEPVTRSPLETSLGRSWTVTAATTGAQGLVYLLGREAWQPAHGQQIRRKVRPLLDHDDPALRLIAVNALPGIFGIGESLIPELERRLAAETDHYIGVSLTQLLCRLLYKYPEQVDNVLERLASHAAWKAISECPGEDHEIGAADQGSIAIQALAILAIVHETPYASRVLTTWLTAPADHPGRAAGALHSLGDLLNLADPGLHKAQERLFEFIRAGSQTAPYPADFADHLARQLYFASGAFDGKQPAQPTKPRGDLRRFTSLALPLLAALAAIHEPRVTLHIVQTADQLSQAAPKQALLIAAKAITSDQAYCREPLGVDAALSLIRHIAARHRDILLGDTEATRAVRQLLDSFVRLGWEQAITLAEELDELFN